MEDITRTASWAKHFDILLHDLAGLATFTEFLKKAYCQENIMFWIKCQDYKMMNDEQRKIGAVMIFDDHVDLTSSEQINIDEITRLAIVEGLSEAGANLFDRAQKHIYLMLQQDSYRRFLKSDLYQQAVLAESQQKPFPFCSQPVKLTTPNDTAKTSKHPGKIDAKGRPSLIPIPLKAASKRKSIFSSKEDKKLKDGTEKKEKHSDLMKQRNAAALPNTPVEKEEKSSGNSSSGGLLGFFRRRSVGNAGKGKPFTQRSVSSPTVNKIRISTTAKSRPIPLSTARKSVSDMEQYDRTPSILEHDIANSGATYNDVVQTLCLTENWNGVIQPFSEDDFDDAKFTRTTVLRRRTDGINPGGVIPIREDYGYPYPPSQNVSSMNQRLSHNRSDSKSGCIDNLQQQLSGHMSDAPALPPRRHNQFINSTSSSSSANVTADVTTDFSHKNKHHMSFGTLFSGRKSTKEKNSGRRSIDTAAVKKELVQLRSDDDLGMPSSKMNKRHSLETLIEF